MALSHSGTAHALLRGSERFHRDGSVVLGNCDPEEMCDITVKVRRKAALPEPDASKPISRADLVAKYGADPKDLEHVEQVLTQARIDRGGEE